MRECEYCGTKTDVPDNYCPNCGSALPAQEKKNEPEQPFTINHQVYINNNNKPAQNRGLVIFLVIMGSFILISFISGVSRRMSPPRSYSGSNIAYSYGADDDEDEEESIAEITPENCITDSGLKQMVETIFKKEISQISWEEISDIKTIYFGASTAYSFDVLDRQNVSQATTLVLDGEVSSLDSLKYFAGLESLFIYNSSLSYNTLPEMENLKILIYGTSTREEDLSSYAKYKNLETLSVCGSSVTSLKGIGELASLKNIILDSTSITELSILSNMQSIEGISLIDNSELTSMQSIEKMTWLKRLHIEDVEYTNFSFIANFDKLEQLTLVDTDAKNFNFLPELTKLTYLKISGNGDVTEIPSLAPLQSLTDLYINCGETDDVSYLSGLSNVKNAVILSPDSLEPLRTFTSLENLELSFGWLLQDASPLGSLSNLKYLKLTKTSGYYNISGMSALGNLSNLEVLDLSESEGYFDNNFIFKLTNLTHLYFGKGPIIGDFSNIENLTSLRELTLPNVSIALQYYYESDGFITSIGTSEKLPLERFSGNLAKLVNLEYLDLSKNEIKSIDFVSSCTNLEVLIISDTYVTDVSPVKDLKGLKQIDITKCAIENLDVFDSMPNTVVIGR